MWLVPGPERGNIPYYNAAGDYINCPAGLVIVTIVTIACQSQCCVGGFPEDNKRLLLPGALFRTSADRED